MSFLPSPLPTHDLVTIVHHSIVDSLAILFNLLLLLAVILKSPSSLRSYKVLLLNSAIIDLISSATMLMTMARAVPARHVLAYIYDGPCAFVSGFFCHCLYTVMLATLSQSLFLIAASFAYRLPTPSGKSVSLAALLVSIPNFIIITTFIFMPDDEMAVRAELRVVRPEYRLDEYCLQGHTSIFNVFTLFTILAMTVPIGPTLVVIFIFRQMVLTKLAAHTAMMSGRTAQMHNTLTKASEETGGTSGEHHCSLGSSLPVFFSGAVLSYALCQFDVICSPVQEHFIMECVSFMALLAPAITLYCMKPYKDFVMSLVRCNFTEATRSTVESTTTRVGDKQTENISTII